MSNKKKGWGILGLIALGGLAYLAFRKGGWFNKASSAQFVDPLASNYPPGALTPSAFLPGPGMLRVPPRGYTLPFGMALPAGAYYTGKVTSSKAPPMAIDQSTQYFAEILLPNGRRDTIRVVMVG